MSGPDVTVLCVDDDLDLLTVIARILRRDGYEVLSASSPLAALEILHSRRVAVMVSDFEMPEMNGVELAVRARALSPETTRLMLTGMRSADTALAGINVGEVFRFLHKPFEPDTLRDAVAAAVAHHQAQVEVQGERSKMVRRQRLFEALEADHPGITIVVRDEDGAYLLDGEAHQQAPRSLAGIAVLGPRSS